MAHGPQAQRLIVDVNTLFGFWPWRNLDTSIASLLDRMDKAGVGRAVTCSTRGILYDFKEGNDETFEACRNSAERLIPAATINPSSYFGVREEVERVANMGFRLVRFFPHEQEWTISQRHCVKLLEQLAKTDLILMLPSTEGITTIAGVTRGMPNTVVIETLRAYPHLAELIAVAQENPRLYIELHSVGCADYVELLCREVGPERLLFGSAAPAHCISAASLPIIHASISEKAKRQILSENALHLLERPACKP